MHILYKPQDEYIYIYIYSMNKNINASVCCLPNANKHTKVNSLSNEMSVITYYRTHTPLLSLHSNVILILFYI